MRRLRWRESVAGLKDFGARIKWKALGDKKFMDAGALNAIIAEHIGYHVVGKEVALDLQPFGK